MSSWRGLAASGADAQSACTCASDLVTDVCGSCLIETLAVLLLLKDIFGVDKLELVAVGEVDAFRSSDRWACLKGA